MFKDASFEKRCRALFNFAPFPCYGLFCKRERQHGQYQNLGGFKTKPSHILKIADTLFEGDVRGDTSDVDGAAPIIHAWKRTNLSEAVFLGISLKLPENNFQ